MLVCALSSDFSFPHMLGVFPKVLEYLHVTLFIAVVALAAGLVMGTMLAVVKHVRLPLLCPIVTVYVDFLRSTPFIVQLFLFYYGLVPFIKPISNMSPEVALTITLSLNASAYITEIIRGAISSVPAGQMEAALSSGMTSPQAMWRIILPQAIRVAVPTLSNTFVDLIKSTAIGFTIGVMEMMSRTQLENAGTFRYFEGYAAVALIYWAVIALFSVAQRRLEKHLGRAYKKV